MQLKYTARRKEKRANATPEEREARLKTARDRNADARTNETVKEREARLKGDRDHHKDQYYGHLETEEVLDSIDRATSVPPPLTSPR
jgi:hypothetical protein